MVRRATATRTLATLATIATLVTLALADFSLRSRHDDHKLSRANNVRNRAAAQRRRLRVYTIVEQPKYSPLEVRFALVIATSAPLHSAEKTARQIAASPTNGIGSAAAWALI